MGDMYSNSQKCTSRFEKSKSLLWTCLTKEWWNIPAWRKGIIDKLEGEAKYIQNLIIDYSQIVL